MASANLEDLRIDEGIWSTGSPERRHEWRLAINEIIQEGAFEVAGRQDQSQTGAAVVTGTLRVVPGRVLFDLQTAGSPLASHELPLDQIEPLIDDYMQTIREMSKLGVGSNSPRLEALDIAKRLTHDEAGDLIVSHLTTLRPDHATARRLFTLLVTIFHDTTKLAAAPHRLQY